MKQRTLSICISASMLCLAFASSADAALVSRLGGQAYYDTDADITWSANVLNAPDWQTAVDLAAGLNIAGVTGWRLPTTLIAPADSTCSASDSTGVNCTGSELGNLFYNVLGGVANTSIYTTGNANVSLFSNLTNGIYWSGTEHPADSSFAYYFEFNLGGQYN